MRASAHSLFLSKKPGPKPGKPHKIFENRLKQDFHADKSNQKWCTDFTYLYLKGGDVRYNCTIIDLYDRSVAASITNRHITSDLAIRTLQKALHSQHPAKGGLILYNPQEVRRLIYTTNVIESFNRQLRKVTKAKSVFPHR